MGGISTSKWPHFLLVLVSTGWGVAGRVGSQYLLHHVPLRGGVGWWWKRPVPVVGAVRGALLGPETTGPVPLCGGGGVVSGFPASCRWSWSPCGGGRPPVCGVCGLLFENCIVDASILRTGAAADPGGPSLWGCAWWVVVPCS
jgi:hypothetical protein